MIAFAPRSASISAEISPVKAPDGSAWQSWAPIAIFDPSTSLANIIKRVAGGQIVRSTLADRSAAPCKILPSSAVESASPFIFQLPATSGRRVDAVIRYLFHEPVPKP